jgi:hypothetical protein
VRRSSIGSVTLKDVPLYLSCMTTAHCENMLGQQPTMMLSKRQANACWQLQFLRVDAACEKSSPAPTHAPTFAPQPPLVPIPREPSQESIATLRQLPPGATMLTSLTEARPHLRAELVVKFLLEIETDRYTYGHSVRLEKWETTKVRGEIWRPEKAPAWPADRH